MDIYKNIINPISTGDDSNFSAESAVDKINRPYIEFFNAVMDGLGIIDEHNKLVLCNPAFAKILDMDSPSQIIGKNVFTFLDKDQKAVFEDKIKSCREGKSSRFELRITTGQRNIKFVYVSITPRFNKKRKYIGAIGDITDITEIKEIEHALRDTERRNRSIMDHIALGISLIGPDMRIISMNKKMQEWFPDVDENKHPLCFKAYNKPCRDEICSHCPTVKVFRDGLIHQAEIETPDGDDIINFKITASPLKDEYGNTYAAIETVEDVTETIKNRQVMIQSEKLASLGTLAAGVAHELNNPIGYINSNLRAMLKYLVKITNVFDDFESVTSDNIKSMKEILVDFNDAINESLEGGDRVKKIVSDLKNFTRMEKSGKEYADINSGIKSTLNIVWNELKYKCKVETEYGELPELYCIPGQLNQVFLNLLVNASHAIVGNEGLVIIKTWADEKAVYVSVKDNGIGIPPEKIKRIFEPFYTTKPAGKGTGLGLSIAYDIVKKHKGIIEIKTKVGVGTEFLVILPLDGLLDAKEAVAEMV